MQEKFDPGTTDGYIYVLSYGDGVTYKIGRTRNLKRRIKEVCGGAKMPYEFELLIASPVSDAPTVEKLIHAVLDAHQVNGEWFHFDGAYGLYRLALIMQAAAYDPWSMIYTDNWYDLMDGVQASRPVICSKHQAKVELAELEISDAGLIIEQFKQNAGL